AAAPEGSALRRLVCRDEAGAGGAGRCLVLDCRPFLAHSAGHIRGALNVRCNTIVRRRARRREPGADPAGRGRGGRPARGQTVALVVRALRRDTARADIRLLAGGYERFSSEYPEFCAKTKSLSNVSPPTSAEPLDLGCSSCGTPFHDQGGPVEILPFLYLGSAYHAARRDMLDALGITALLNVSSDCPNHFEGHYQYKCIPVEDNHKADISSWFMEAIEYIDSVKECCGRVLVHCQAGISRSATICLAYLMMKKRVKLEEAFEFVKQRRSIISPNFSFMGQLLQFESQVLATSYAVEAVSPSGTLRERGKATSTPTSQFVFSFPVSVGVHATPSSLPYLHSPITTSPSC
uniref:Dual specificity protein phosphatase n=1 Tax=Malurus cyaneus samueli TaxID=2593467 RepID=A0A8C5U3L7_9PASS